MFLGTEFTSCPPSKPFLKPAGSASTASATGISSAARTRMPASASSPSRPEQEIVLVEQFRIPMQRQVIEIPAGHRRRRAGTSRRIAGRHRRPRVVGGNRLPRRIDRAAHRHAHLRGHDLRVHPPVSTPPTSSASTRAAAWRGEDIIVHHVPLAGPARVARASRKPPANSSISKSTPRSGWRGFRVDPPQWFLFRGRNASLKNP